MQKAYLRGKLRRCIGSIVILLLIGPAVVSPETPGEARNLLVNVSIVLVAQRSALNLRVCLRSLQEALREATEFAFEVTIVECDGGGPGSLSRQTFLASASLLPAARLLFNDSGKRLSLIAATEKATADVLHHTHHILFIQDTVEVSLAALQAMVNILEDNCRVAVVGAASSTPDGNTYHRGVAFDLGPRKKSCLSSDMYDDEYAYGSGRGGGGTESSGTPLSFALPHEAIWAFHVGQGLRAPASAAPAPAASAVPSTAPAPASLPMRARHASTSARGELTLVDAVSGGCWIIRRSIWQELRGLDPRVPDSQSVVDLCMRARRRLHSVALQDTAWVTHHADAPSSGYDTATRTCNTDLKNIGEYIGGVQVRGLLESRWGNLVYAALGGGSRRAVKATVLWNMECGDDAVRGLTTEAVNLLVALNPLANVVAEVSNRRECEALLLSAFPFCMASLAIRLLHKQVPPGRTIQVLHRDPGRYKNFRKVSYSKEDGSETVYVGRSMYETDQIPSEWLSPAACLVDQLWLPSHFNRRTFANAGVAESKLRVLHEAVDTHQLFRPP